MRRLLLIGVIVAALAGSAEALTLQDVIELSRAGLGEDVLLALIEVDRRVFAIDTATLKRLKAAGVSERVIAALVRSGREIPVEPPLPPTEEQHPASPAPQVVVVDHHDHPVERIREVPVAVPVYVPVFVGSRRPWIDGTHPSSTFLPFQTGPFQTAPLTHPAEPRKREPVYWGWGGKLRPDAWQPASARRDR
jgi:hypothetical protein